MMSARRIINPLWLIVFIFEILCILFRLVRYILKLRIQPNHYREMLVGVFAVVAVFYPFRRERNLSEQQSVCILSVGSPLFGVYHNGEVVAIIYISQRFGQISSEERRVGKECRSR